MEQDERKRDYNPPGWLVTRYDLPQLDPERARRLSDLRVRMCETWGKDNEKCKPGNLWLKALDLLLAHEGALLTKVETLDV
jgi:hypothetical protein